MSLKLLLMAIMSRIQAAVEWLELDYMEYASDAAAQTAHVTSEASSEQVDQQNALHEGAGAFVGDYLGHEYRGAQSFQLSDNLLVTAVEVGNTLNYNTPTGNWTLRIETDSSGVPSGSLADANASIVVAPPSPNNTVKGTFATPFNLTGSTTYWLVIQCDNQNSAGWQPFMKETNVYANGTRAVSDNGVWGVITGHDLYFKIYATKPVLQCYSENTIISQGTYALKGFAVATDSLNDTLTRTIDPPIDLSGKTQIKFDIRASRTGSNIKVGFHDSGGNWIESTPNILSADEFQEVTVDISAVADADKDVTDQIKTTIVNADAENIFYIDNIRYS